jgi:hypothetical protein
MDFSQPSMLEVFRQFCGSANCRLLGLCLGAVSPSLAQITQGAYVANQHDNTMSVVDMTMQDVVRHLSQLNG